MPGFSLIRLSVTGALMCFVAVSASELAVAVSVEPWVRLALRLETAPKPLDMPGSLRLRLGERMEESESRICGDLARSRVTVALDLLRRSVAANAAPAEADKAISAAGKTVRDALSCNPSDANLWYLLALTESRSGAGWERIQELLVMSASLAPFEADLLFKRSRFLVILLSRQENGLDERLKSDLRTALTFVDLPSATTILNTLLVNGQQALSKELVDALPASRRVALAESQKPKRPPFGRAERFRHFDFRPFGAPQPR